MSFKLKRTRHRGVYRSGPRFVVPFTDDAGNDRQRVFQTLDEARQFRLVVIAAERAREDYDAPWGSGPHVG